MDPWPRSAVGCLKGANFMIALQRQCDLVEPLQQAFAAARINFEPMLLARWRSDRLPLEVDTNPSGPLCECDLRGQAIDNLLIDDNRKNSVLKAIGKEDVAETRADDGADAHLLWRPYRPFAGRAAAEIRTSDQDFCLPIGLSVQDEFGIFRTVGQIAQRAECPFAKRAADRVSDQTLDADDNIGVNVATHDRCCDRHQ